VNHEEAEDIKRHFDVIAEQLQSSIGQVAEGVALNAERLDRVEGKIDRIEGRLDRMEVRLDAHDTRFDRLEGEMREGFTEVKSMIKLSYAEIDGRLAHLEREVTDLRSRLEAVEAKLAS